MLILLFIFEKLLKNTVGILLPEYLVRVWITLKPCSYIIYTVLNMLLIFISMMGYTVLDLVNTVIKKINKYNNFNFVQTFSRTKFPSTCIVHLYKIFNVYKYMYNTKNIIWIKWKTYGI